MFDFGNRSGVISVISEPISHVSFNKRTLIRTKVSARGIQYTKICRGFDLMRSNTVCKKKNLNKAEQQILILVVQTLKTSNYKVLSIDGHQPTNTTSCALKRIVVINNSTIFFCYKIERPDSLYVIRKGNIQKRRRRRKKKDN